MKKKIYSASFIIERNNKKILRNIFVFFTLIISVSLSAQNPLLLKNPIPGGSGRDIYEMVSTTAGKTFFSTIDRNNHFSNLWGLWVTDGTPSGTTKLSLADGQYSSTEATMLTPLGNNKIVFAGDNEGGHGEVWVSDGTQAGTFGLEEFNPGGGTYAMAILGICSLGTDVIYAVNSNNHHGQLRKTNGSKGGTELIYDFGENSSDLGNFKNINNIVYFSHNVIDGGNYNSEIWRTDGTTAGTYLVKDFGAGYGFGAGGTGRFMSFKNNIYFITLSSAYGDYLWKSDGTPSGTAPLKQISTSYQSDNGNPSYAAVENNIVLANNLLYFTANDGIHGRELWKTDGTSDGTGMIFDFSPGSVGSNPNWLCVLNNELYFVANSSLFDVGNELYKYNGAQFSQPIDIFPGPASSNPANLTVQNNTILFSATGNTSHGNEFWMTDGSSTNTIEIANITPSGNSSSNPSLISVSGNNVYFVANYDANRDGLDNELCIFKYTAPDKIWTGNASGDVSDANNWFPSGAPLNTDNVLIPPYPLNSLSDPHLSARDFWNNGSTINVGNGQIQISNDFYNAGTINVTNGGFTIVSDGSGAVHHVGTGTFNGQLTLSSGVNVRLTSYTKLNTLRVEGADTILLGDYNLIVDDYPMLIPAMITDGYGSTYMPVGASPVTFPVGSNTTSLNPVTITNNGPSEYLGVNVKDGVYTDGYGYSLNTVDQQVVNKTWNIGALASGGSPDVNITLQWNASDELPGFDRNNVYLNHYTSDAWDSGTPGMASGTGPYTFTRNGFTSFSPFAISSSAAVLPVTLVLFNANRVNNTVQLNWQTTSEINASFYEIERSADGSNFSKIGQVNILSNRSSLKDYSYTDAQPLQGANFYRLKIVDADGKFTYSKTAAVRMDERGILQLRPNPAANILYIQPGAINENGVIEIIDATGRKVKEETIFLNNNSSFSIDIHDLPKGVYHLLFISKSKTERQKFIKE